MGFTLGTWCRHCSKGLFTGLPPSLQSVYRTVTETLSPVADLGQDKKEENGGTATSNGNGNASDAEKFDTLELRNRSA